MMSLKTNANNDITNSVKTSLKKVEIGESFSVSDKINPKKEEICLIEDSSDGLQWCADLDYEYKSDETSSFSVPKSIFEASLVVGSDSYSYTTPPSSNHFSNHLDVNLAQIDIETFRSEDINTVFLQQTEDDCPSLSSSFRSTADVQESSLLFDDSNPLDDIREEDNNRTNLEKELKNDISVDSLDMSLFEKNTSKLLQKCSQRDKNNYTIAFEGSLTASHDSNPTDAQMQSHRRRGHCRNHNETMTRSEHFVTAKRTNDRNLNHGSNDLNQEIDDSIAKLTQSIPDIRALLRMNGHYRLPYCPVSGFIPLYDLQSSQSSNSHSSSSEFSPPRSLVKMFMQSRSPLSSQPISPSLSYDRSSQESGAGTAVESPVRPLYYNILELTREANNNILLGDDHTANDNSGKGRTRLDSHRIPFDLKQTFPIKEVDENMSDSSIADIHMTSSRDLTPTDLNRNPVIYPKMSRKSVSNDKHLNTQSSETNGSSHNMNERSLPAQSKLCYHKHAVKTTSTQMPVHFVDKQIQASMEAMGPTGRPTAAHMSPTAITPETPNDCNKPFYVYYPNYSLPDLSFLGDIFDKHSNCGPKKVYLSPTKHQMPDKESVSVRMRRSAKSAKCRPKSFNDFETLSKQNFNHIKDWDSLNILLPNEFKELIQKTKNMSNIEKQSENQMQSTDCLAANVRMRSRRSSGQLSDNSSYYSRRGYARNKRYSLQEYPFSEMTETETNCHNISHNPETTSGCLPRSQTLPNCHNSCHCHQHCCHTCCHSCCRTPRQSPSTMSANKSFLQTSNCELNTNSIDRLCQLLAMDLSFKKLMAVINGQNLSPNRSNFETVPESKDENQFEPKDQSFTESRHYSTESTNKSETSFEQLKQRWESMAGVSPTEAVNRRPHVSDRSRTVETVTKPVINGQKNRKKPEVARKPQVVLRRPHSLIPRPTSLNTDPTLASGYRKSLIPVPKAGLRSPVTYTPKVKTNNGSKA